MSDHVAGLKRVPRAPSRCPRPRARPETVVQVRSLRSRARARGMRYWADPPGPFTRSHPKILHPQTSGNMYLQFFNPSRKRERREGRTGRGRRCRPSSGSARFPAHPHLEKGSGGRREGRGVWREYVEEEGTGHFKSVAPPPRGAGRGPARRPTRMCGHLFCPRRGGCRAEARLEEASRGRGKRA